MKPTAKQLAYLRSLAISRGTSFTPPTTKAQASKTITELRARHPSTPSERAIETADTDRARRQVANAAHVDIDRDTTGHGSNARWR